MKFTCSQKNFLEIILTVQKAVSTRSSMPILEGILIESEKDVIRLMGNNLDLAIESYMEANILQEGSVVVPSRLLSEVVRRLPDAEMEVSVQTNNAVKFTCLNSIVTLQGFASEDFPSLPDISENQPFEISKMLLSKMIRETIFAVAVDEARPVLTGALMEIDENQVTMVCLDGYRLGMRKGKLDTPYEHKKVIIPGKSLQEIGKIMEEDDQKISITVSDRHVLFDMGYTRIVSRVVEGEYINYKQIIPEDYKTRVKVDTEILEDSIDRASLIAKEGKNNLIKLALQDQKMVITSNSESGQVYEEIPIILEGKDLEIAFNARYFMDMLKILEDQEICLDFTTSVSPCVVRPIKGNDYTYLLLPVRIFV
ncbi:MAG TPA: DNA polymerase III subunit beta [Clostridiales bacterium]|nr:DNA polymerase III subunit beta [Clostridiales bacterium]